jgi:hypothetical protein
MEQSACWGDERYFRCSVFRSWVRKSIPSVWGIKHYILIHKARKRVLDVITLFLLPCKKKIMKTGVPVLTTRHWHSICLPKVHCTLQHLCYNSGGLEAYVTVCPYYCYYAYGYEEVPTLPTPYYEWKNEALHLVSLFITCSYKMILNSSRN